MPLSRTDMLDGTYLWTGTGNGLVVYYATRDRDLTPSVQVHRGRDHEDEPYGYDSIRLVAPDGTELAHQVRYT